MERSIEDRVEYLESRTEFLTKQLYALRKLVAALEKHNDAPRIAPGLTSEYETPTEKFERVKDFIWPDEEAAVEPDGKEADVRRALDALLLYHNEAETIYAHIHEALFEHAVHVAMERVAADG